MIISKFCSSKWHDNHVVQISFSNCIMFGKMVQGSIYAGTKQSSLGLYHASNSDCIFGKEAKNKTLRTLGCLTTTRNERL